MSIQTKTFEIRDKGTFIPAIGVRIAPYELPVDSLDRYLMRRAGYGDPLVLLTRLEGGRRAEYDPYSWGDRTWTVAHHFITTRWDEIESGGGVDVEFSLGETNAPKLSERLDEAEHS